MSKWYHDMLTEACFDELESRIQEARMLLPSKIIPTSPSEYQPPPVPFEPLGSLAVIGHVSPRPRPPGSPPPPRGEPPLANLEISKATDEQLRQIFRVNLAQPSDGLAQEMRWFRSALGVMHSRPEHSPDSSNVELLTEEVFNLQHEIGELALRVYREQASVGELQMSCESATDRLEKLNLQLLTETQFGDYFLTLQRVSCIGSLELLDNCKAAVRDLGSAMRDTLELLVDGDLSVARLHSQKTKFVIAQTLIKKIESAKPIYCRVEALDVSDISAVEDLRAAKTDIKQLLLAATGLECLRIGGIMRAMAEDKLASLRDAAYSLCAQQIATLMLPYSSPLPSNDMDTFFLELKAAPAAANLGDVRHRCPAAIGILASTGHDPLDLLYQSTAVFALDAKPDRSNELGIEVARLVAAGQSDSSDGPDTVTATFTISLASIRLLSEVFAALGVSPSNVCSDLAQLAFRMLVTGISRGLRSRMTELLEVSRETIEKDMSQVLTAPLGATAGICGLLRDIGGAVRASIAFTTDDLIRLALRLHSVDWMDETQRSSVNMTVRRQLQSMLHDVKVSLNSFLEKELVPWLKTLSFAALRELFGKKAGYKQMDSTVTPFHERLRDRLGTSTRGEGFVAHCFGRAVTPALEGATTMAATPSGLFMAAFVSDVVMGLYDLSFQPPDIFTSVLSKWLEARRTMLIDGVAVRSKVLPHNTISTMFLAVSDALFVEATLKGTRDKLWRSRGAQSVKSASRDELRDAAVDGATFLFPPALCEHASGGERSADFIAGQRSAAQLSLNPSGGTARDWSLPETSGRLDAEVFADLIIQGLQGQVSSIGASAVNQTKATVQICSTGDNGCSFLTLPSTINSRDDIENITRYLSTRAQSSEVRRMAAFRHVEPTLILRVAQPSPAIIKVLRLLTRTMKLMNSLLPQAVATSLFLEVVELFRSNFCLSLRQCLQKQRQATEELGLGSLQQMDMPLSESVLASAVERAPWIYNSAIAEAAFLSRLKESTPDVDVESPRYADVIHFSFYSPPLLPGERLSAQVGWLTDNVRRLSRSEFVTGHEVMEAPLTSLEADVEAVLEEMFDYCALVSQQLSRSEERDVKQMETDTTPTS